MRRTATRRRGRHRTTRQRYRSLRTGDRGRDLVPGLRLHGVIATPEAKNEAENLQKLLAVLVEAPWLERSARLLLRLAPNLVFLCIFRARYDPKFDFAFLNRAYGKFLLSDLEGAAADFQKAFDVETTSRDYPNLWLWVIRARNGKQAEGDTALRAYVKGLEKPDAWYAHLAAFLLGDEKEEALLAAADEGTDEQKVEQRCEAFYYAGLKRSLGGDMEGAAAFFKVCLATGKSDFMEFHAAKVALAGLSEPGK